MVKMGWLYEEPNNRMHSDSKKRRSFLALLFAVGDVSIRQTGVQNESDHPQAGKLLPGMAVTSQGILYLPESTSIEWWLAISRRLRN